MFCIIEPILLQVSPEQIIASPTKRLKTENVLKVTAEGLKAVTPEKQASKCTTHIDKTDSRLTSNITLLRSPGSNSNSQAQTQARVFVINPQSSNFKTGQTVVQAMLPATSTSNNSNTPINTATGTIKNTVPDSTAINQETDDDTAFVPNVRSENELPSLKVETSEEKAGNLEGKEQNMTVDSVGDKCKIQVVAVEKHESNSCGGDMTEVVEQQDLLPGQILQVRDTDGRILHVTAGENGELIQVETDENGVTLQETVETTQVTSGGYETQTFVRQQEEERVESQPDLYQTEDGVIFIQNSDGSIQVHGHSDQPIPLETVQALLAMESEGQVVEQT